MLELEINMNHKDLVKCPICKGKTYIILKDHRFHSQFIYRCKKCNETGSIHWIDELFEDGSVYKYCGSLITTMEAQKRSNQNEISI